MQLKFNVKYQIPSLNRLFDLHYLDRVKERRKAHLALFFALSPEDQNFLTQTTSVQNTLLTAYGTLALYLTTDHKTSSCRCRKDCAPKAKKPPRSS